MEAAAAAGMSRRIKAGPGKSQVAPVRIPTPKHPNFPGAARKILSQRGNSLQAGAEPVTASFPFPVFDKGGWIPQFQEFCRPHSQSWGNKGSIFQRIPQPLRSPGRTRAPLSARPRAPLDDPARSLLDKINWRGSGKGRKTLEFPPWICSQPLPGAPGVEHRPQPRLGINPGNSGCAPSPIPGSPALPNSRISLIPEIPALPNSRIPGVPGRQRWAGV